MATSFITLATVPPNIIPSRPAFIVLTYVLPSDFWYTGIVQGMKTDIFLFPSSFRILDAWLAWQIFIKQHEVIKRRVCVWCGVVAELIYAARRNIRRLTRWSVLDSDSPKSAISLEHKMIHILFDIIVEKLLSRPSMSMVVSTM